MISKSGYELIQSSTISVLKETIFPYVTLVTPNLPETEYLLGAKINTPVEQQAAAIELGNQFNINVLIKGGHLESEVAADVLYLNETQECHWFSSKRIHSMNSHGTGCSLSSAIASYLAQGCSLKDAIDNAKRYLTQALESAATWRIGRGCGPVDHFYFLESQYDFR
jgi:hydroxymethylpyrimidine/phosphomethylpyrimidine kinase